MLFISGIHGVGKTHFCNIIKEKTGIPTYSASDLISKIRNTPFDKNKIVPDINENQKYLIMAVSKLRASGNPFVIDGHFCLLNKFNEIQRIPYELFLDLKPEAIVLLTEKPRIIAKRRKERDNLNISIESIECFQEAESTYAEEVANKLGAELFISNGQEDLNKAIDFISNIYCK